MLFPVSLEPSVPFQPLSGQRSRQNSPRIEIKEMGCLHRISFISFCFWWKGSFMTLFCYGSPLGLMASIAPMLPWQTCKVRSLDLYLKKLLVYIHLQNSVKHLCSIRAWVPMSFFLSFSLFLADSLVGESWLHNPGNISFFPSFTFSLLTLDHQLPGQ